jgi:hypothetical protein
MNKYPLVSNSSSLTIQELQAGDTLLVDNLAVTGDSNVAGESSIGGNLTVGGNVTVTGSINANLGNVAVENLVVEGQTNLGLVGNITIDGGSNNYVLRTDGAGNLTWANIQSEIANAAGSNTYVQFNNDNLFGASANFTFNKDTNELSVQGIANVTELKSVVANLGSVSNVHIFGGSAGQILATDGSGNLTWVTDDNDPNIGDGGNANSGLRLVAALDGGYANSIY